MLVEASPALRDLQTQTLQDYAPRWVGSVSDLPEMPTFLVANEFFDALPIRQFLRDGAGWRERLIGVEGDSLAFGLGPISEHVALRVRVQDTKDGDLVELCAAAIPIVTTIARADCHPWWGGPGCGLRRLAFAGRYLSGPAGA